MPKIKNPLAVFTKAAPVSGIKINDYSGTTLDVSSPVEVTASFLPAGATLPAKDYQYHGTITEWTSSDPSKISVTTTREGDKYITKVVAISSGSGSATITVKAGEFSDSFTAEFTVENTLSRLKIALNNGQAESLFPPGTEIPDTYANSSNPLIVGIYENIDGKTRVGLVRRYVDPIWQTFGSNSDYRTSAVLNFLQTTYLNNCSEELKPLLAEASVPYYPGSGPEVQVASKWHLLSSTNVMGSNSNREQPAWPYWQQVTGLSSGSNSANDGRVRTGRGASGKVTWWLRSWGSSSWVWDIVSTGEAVSTGIPTSSFGVLPICYITQD